MHSPCFYRSEEVERYMAEKGIGYSEKGLLYDGKRVCSWVAIKTMKIRNGKLIIMGVHRFDNIGEFECCFIDDKNRNYVPEFTDVATRKYSRHGDLIVSEKGFETEIELGDIKTLSFAVKKKTSAVNKAPKSFLAGLRFSRNAKIFRKYKESYYAREGYILSVNGKNIEIARGGFLSLLRKELRLAAELIKGEKKYDVAAVRLLALLKKAIKRRPVWIVSDREDAAGDNGEALYKHLIKNEKQARVYFAIDRDCSDYQKISRLGKVLKIGSLKYKLNFLAADMIISSQTGDWVTNAFGEKMEYYKSMFDFDVVFLQHGVIMTDLSIWFKGYNKDLSLFITSAKEEYESILQYGFNCNKKVVKLTGLPRFDYLENKREKKIVFLPTWRKTIAGPPIPGASHRQYSEDFKESEYYAFYNGLINNDKLLRCMREEGYTGEMYIHPAFSVQAKDFTGNETIKVINSAADYNSLFRENALMITDYSSVVADFVYLKKPVIYTQFDFEEFFAGHHCRSGYFDYERDGFGPVVHDQEAAVEAIINCINSGCKMQNKYAARAESFFAYNDKNNCRRVYDEIKKIEEDDHT